MPSAVGAFQNSSGIFGYKFMQSFDAIHITSFKMSDSNKSGIVEIPDKIDGYYVENIDKQAFANNSLIKSIILSPHLLIISDRAFSDCVNLETVRFPKSLIRIGHSSFAGCTSLKSVSLDSVSYIDTGAFAGCKNLESINLGNKIETIHSSLITNNDKLETLILPEGVKKIFPYAFLDCTNLKNINIPSSVISIPGGVFTKLPSLTNVIINPKNKYFYIKDDVLYQKHIFEDLGTETYSLVSVFPKKNDINFVIPSNVNRIMSHAFSGSKIHNLQIPESVTSIENRAFDNMINLQRLKIPSSVKACAFIMFENESIKFIDFSNGIKDLVLSLPEDSNALKVVRLPITLDRINITTIHPDTKLLLSKETNIFKELKDDDYNICCAVSELNKMLTEIENENKEL